MVKGGGGSEMPISQTSLMNLPISKQPASVAERLQSRLPDSQAQPLPRASWDQEQEAKIHKKLQGQKP